MKTKARGIHANFTTTCATCADDITITNGRPEQHVCREREPISLADIQWPEAPTPTPPY